MPAAAPGTVTTICSAVATTKPAEMPPQLSRKPVCSRTGAARAVLGGATSISAVRGSC